LDSSCAKRSRASLPFSQRELVSDSYNHPNGVAAAIYSLVEMSRRGHRTGEFSYYRGVPRILGWIVLDDEEYEKRTSKAKAQSRADSKG